MWSKLINALRKRGVCKSPLEKQLADTKTTLEAPVEKGCLLGSDLGCRELRTQNGSGGKRKRSLKGR